MTAWHVAVAEKVATAICAIIVARGRAGADLSAALVVLREPEADRAPPIQALCNRILALTTVSNANVDSAEQRGRQLTPLDLRLSELSEDEFRELGSSLVDLLRACDAIVAKDHAIADTITRTLPWNQQRGGT